MDPCFHGLIVKSEELLCVDFIDQDNLTDLEHQRILEGLVIALGNGENLNVDAGAGVILCRADEIPDILQKNQIEILR